MICTCTVCTCTITINKLYYHAIVYYFLLQWSLLLSEYQLYILLCVCHHCSSISDNIFICYYYSSTHEADFSTLHFSLTKKLGVKASGKQNITVSIAAKIIKGDLQKLRKDLAYMINKSTVTVDKLGFPDVIFPG